ncbi:hypothetical protein EJB05_43129, partial [Eragrostis curvula]
MQRLISRSCRGEPAEQPVEVRGGGVGVRGADPAVELHGESDVDADGAAAGADDRGLWRAVAGHGEGGHHEQLLHAGVHDRSGFPPSRLVPYQATQGFHEALLNGTIGAVVDETPYLRLFLKAYCDNFTTAAHANRTGGFGFAFPKGSPYVADLSRAILNLTESDELSLIERKWFGDAEGCAAQGSPFTSDSLSFASFWGLFLITGATSLLCCAVHLATFIVANRRR